ncbi:hypothetical protein KR50_13120 [Jeotgalibacillus campisalis]|uniref:Uncharacterized protein n=1 Tax=Jeotgalibacillus campisalis TaxID=220754 RepID=A0A0C2VIL7_9BACL|nr:hypothetical protein KR50_13120 [Jeotgalibacillus campisalis]
MATVNQKVLMPFGRKDLLIYSIFLFNFIRIDGTSVTK